MHKQQMVYLFAYKAQGEPLVFPAITICNSNRIHCGHLHQYILDCQKVSGKSSFKFHRGGNLNFLIIIQLNTILSEAALMSTKLKHVIKIILFFKRGV